MIKTKFSIRAYLIGLAFLFSVFLMIKILQTSLSSNSGELFHTIFFSLITIFIFVSLFSEIRTKAIIFQIKGREVVVKYFFGIFPTSFMKNEINGWKYSRVEFRSNVYEYLYLYKDGNKIAKISQYYHRNYFKIKNEIQGEFKYLGYEEQTLTQNFKDIFK
ncbi:hypothetical protein [Chryseobacterium binzhouense]|uniref:hypothetical protein n=1 Tax=Chryseobacterium binzhouense TaxID=2593646 RepID=UPI00117DA31A|nr:hypothetical protein [Chryseobacterium binzhouense]